MTPAELITRALSKITGAIEQHGQEHWSFALANDPTITLEGRLDAGWLVLTAAPHHVPPGREAWATLAANGTLPGGARFALAAGEAGLHLRADVPLDPEVDIERRILEACAGLAHPHDTAAPTAAPASLAVPSELAQRCGATAWPVAPRGPHEIVVDLGVPGAFHQAVVSVRPDGLVAVTVAPLESMPATTMPEINRRAVARLALRLGGIVRLVRAVAALDEPTSLRFEVVQTDPTTVELAHAFAALAVACRLAAAEAQVLAHDEAVARLYLQQSHAVAVSQAA